MKQLLNIVVFKRIYITEVNPVAYVSQRRLIAYS